jgi:hypothetical protein
VKPDTRLLWPEKKEQKKAGPKEYPLRAEPQKERAGERQTIIRA